MDDPLSWPDLPSDLVQFPDVDLCETLGLPPDPPGHPPRTVEDGEFPNNQAATSDDTHLENDGGEGSALRSDDVLEKDAIIADLSRRNRVLRAAVRESAKLLDLNRQLEKEISALRARLATVEVERAHLNEQVVRFKQGK